MQDVILGFFSLDVALHSCPTRSTQGFINILLEMHLHLTTELLSDFPPEPEFLALPLQFLVNYFESLRNRF